MALRTGHGAGKGAPRVEVLPVDELPNGVPALSGPPEAPAKPAERGPGGRMRHGQDARELGRKGGLAKAAKQRALKMLQGLGVRGKPAWLEPYLVDSLAFATAEVTRLAQTVGGGVCGASPASMVQSAALQLAASRAAFEQGDTVKGSRLANDSRQNLLAAYELCAKEAERRPKTAAAAPWLRSGGSKP